MTDALFAGQLAVITGAGSGIGRATALAFAERGADVVVCDVDLDAARRTAELAGLLGARCDAYRVDVADGKAMAAFAAEAGIPDILVNNAGVGHQGTFLATTEEEWRRVLDVNLWGVIHGCRAFGAAMAERGGAERRAGHIVNVASAAAYLPSKDLAAYATSKAAVLMASDCLRAELAGSGIRVSVICPGFVHTNISRTFTFSGFSGNELEAKRERATRLFARRGFPPDKVAEQIVAAVRRRRNLVTITAEAKAGRLLSRFAPAVTRAAARISLG
jgi:NAD(P)-dependent dehydrogenase (short-subunit alcohol dehydrogenase family)